MIDIFRKTYHPPGTAPGTLVSPERPPAEGASLEILLISDGGARSADALDLEGWDAATAERIAWVHVQGAPSHAQLEMIGDWFGLHPLSLEDVANTGQRPKADVYDDHVVIILNQTRWRDDEIVLEQVNLFVGTSFVVSFHNGPEDPFEPVRRRVQTSNRNLANMGAPYLGYALMDLVVDQAFPLMENLGSLLEDLEESVLTSATRETLQRIHNLRRELLLLRRQLWPTREALGRLMREATGVFDATTMPYLRDVYDHTVHIMDLLESYREMAASLVDVYISSVNQRLNEVMKVLTVIATIFIPLTFLVGVYGMNFEHPESPWSMPELYTYYGYPLVWLIMIMVAGGMLYAFKRRGWF
ncbi:magnesium and cobalt transport protein CorA [Thioalkalivibrio denitrificans]|uniref:Magnesium transport protein CorA n=1 Tax=Thioalkalivibrio denitrificans TaxID=108003 RepID=A0A1V3N8V8_9GAMM|nr:magnesium/cobalt transporter CorA [Thioalkalivibrio denitrificans]OOG21474.1 magnesium and cobalt transport protein CorA [Thioalkalivibrio denitrificans]